MVCACVWGTVASVCEREKAKTKETEKAIIVCVFSLSFTLSLVKYFDYKYLIFFQSMIMTSQFSLLMTVMSISTSYWLHSVQTEQWNLSVYWTDAIGINTTYFHKLQCKDAFILFRAGCIVRFVGWSKTKWFITLAALLIFLLIPFRLCVCRDLHPPR